jgi:hypothetical protein
MKIDSVMTSILKVVLKTYLEDDSKPDTTADVQEKKSNKETKKKAAAPPSKKHHASAEVKPQQLPTPAVVQENKKPINDPPSALMIPPLTTSSSGKKLNSFSGNYNGDDIVVSGEMAYVPVSLDIKGVGKVQATALYDTKRFTNGTPIITEQDAKKRDHSSNTYKSDNLTLITKNGSATSTAFYKDNGTGVKTTVSKVAHVVNSATGDLSILKGNYIVIDYDHCTTKEPRTLTLEEGRVVGV